ARNTRKARKRSSCLMCFVSFVVSCLSWFRGVFCGDRPSRRIDVHKHQPREPRCDDANNGLLRCGGPGRAMEPNADSLLIVTAMVDDAQYLNVPFIRSTHFK